MLSFESVEEVCESKSITLVVHPGHPSSREGLRGELLHRPALFSEGRDQTESTSCLCKMVAMSGLCSRSASHPEGTRS